MESWKFPGTPQLASPSRSPCSRNKSILDFPLTHSKIYRNQTFQVSAALKSPRGFGPSPNKKKKIENEIVKKKKKKKPTGEKEEEEEDDEEEGVIPEIVTNRMISRMGFSVGIPLFVGLLFFPFFYYLKVGLKIDVPTWVPFIVSFFFFGSALLGVSYGIVSSSWDPMREGSLLGWNEAKRNWPVFWQSLRGKSGKN